MSTDPFTPFTRTDAEQKMAESKRRQYNPGDSSAYEKATGTRNALNSR